MKKKEDTAAGMFRRPVSSGYYATHSRSTKASKPRSAHWTPPITLDLFTIEMAFICASEDKVGKEQKRGHSGLR